MTADPPDLLLPGLVAARARSAPDAPALVLGEQVTTAGQLHERAGALAAALADAGLAAGDRVVLFLQNDPAYVVALLAVWRLGGIAVAANPMLTARELRLILDDSRARALVTLRDLHAAHGAEAVRGSTVTTVVTTDPFDPSPPVPEGTHDLDALVAAFRGRPAPEHAPGGDDTAVLTYTSGTTGRPKGARNTHANVAAAGRAYRDWFSLAGAGPVLGIAPLFHVTGLSGHIAVALVAEVPLLLTHRFDADAVLATVRRHRPAFTVGAITAVMALARASPDPRADFASFVAIASGGAPVAPATVEEFEERTGCYVHNVYGMTETTSPTHSVPAGSRAPVDPRSGALSVGVPVPPCDTWIVDDGGRELGPGEIGELLVAGPRVVPGYWEKPEETATAFAGGRLRTGDVGLVDAQGWFYVVDRLKDVIVAAGYKVWPRDVEDALLGHPDIAEAAVVGEPDAYRGETVKAFVVPRPGRRLDADDLVAWSRTRVAAYKRPRVVEVVDALPRTNTGKVLRRELRAPAGAPPGPRPGSPD